MTRRILPSGGPTNKSSCRSPIEKYATSDPSGDTLLGSPWGEILGDGAGGEEQVLVADVDPAVVASTRERYPFLDDRRSG